MRAWIGLGSNIGDGTRRLEAALSLLAARSGVTLVRQSGFYLTAAWGEEKQGDFTNAAAEVETDLQPLELLQELLAIELQLGRQRSGKRWGPRCIDLDLLACDDLVLHLPALQLPHPRMHLRAFVLRPLLELDPGYVIPGLGPAEAFLKELGEQRVERIEATH
jgi:2-amino-4-hydroxy-6-hydroxymethyldihydropteridine diphosphokinase